jgi:hypothetical protein
VLVRARRPGQRIGDAEVIGGQHWSCAAQALRALSRRGVLSGESSAPTLESVSMMAASMDVVYLLGGIIVDFSLPMMAWSLRVKTQASVSRSGRRRRLRRIPLVGIALGRQLWQLCVASLALGSVDVGATARMAVVRRGGGLGIHGGQMLHEAKSSCLHGLGDCLVSLVRRGCRLGRCCLG